MTYEWVIERSEYIRENNGHTGITWHYFCSLYIFTGVPEIIYEIKIAKETIETKEYSWNLNFYSISKLWLYYYCQG